jgi:hypothetical protein
MGVGGMSSMSGYGAGAPVFRPFKVDILWSEATRNLCPDLRRVKIIVTLCDIMLTSCATQPICNLGWYS